VGTPPEAFDLGSLIDKAQVLPFYITHFIYYIIIGPGTLQARLLWLYISK
jgi:hypothetical protein